MGYKNRDRFLAEDNAFKKRHFGRLMKVYGHTCSYCDKEYDGYPDIDHADPASIGESFAKALHDGSIQANAVLACRKCNRGERGKFTKTIEQFCDSERAKKVRELLKQLSQILTDYKRNHPADKSWYTQSAPFETEIVVPKIELDLGHKPWQQHMPSVVDTCTSRHVWPNGFNTHSENNSCYELNRRENLIALLVIGIIIINGLIASLLLPAPYSKQSTTNTLAPSTINEEPAKPCFIQCWSERLHTYIEVSCLDSCRPDPAPVVKTTTKVVKLPTLPKAEAEQTTLEHGICPAFVGCTL